MKNVKILSPETVTISSEAVIGEGVVIYPNNHVLGKAVIGKGAVLLPNNIVEDSQIGEGARLTASVVRGAVVGEGAEVGPFANLRKGAVIGRGCRIGDFVEIKNAVIGEGTKVSHLTYIGDADVGRRCNVGCGVVFCNYDGKNKYRTSVGDDCFIGSNVNLVAPVSVGDGSFVAAGTTVAKDVEEGVFVIGRVRQEQNARLAHKYCRGEERKDG